MRIGRLRHRVTIQRPETKRDQYGGIVTTWADVATVWAAVEALRGRELFAAQQTVAQANHRIIIRYRPGITPAMRVVYEERQFDIQAVLDQDGRKRYLELVCQEVVS